MLKSDTTKLILYNLSLKDCINCLLASKQFYVYQFLHNDIMKGFKYCFEQGLKAESMWYIEKLCDSCYFNYECFINIPNFKYAAILGFKKKKCPKILNSKDLYIRTLEYGYSNGTTTHNIFYDNERFTVPFDMQLESEYIPCDDNIFKVLQDDSLFCNSTNYNYLALLNLLQTLTNLCAINKHLIPVMKIGENIKVSVNKFGEKNKRIEYLPQFFSEYVALKLTISLSNIKELNDVLKFKIIKCEFISY
jgi:hypothetical protein